MRKSVLAAVYVGVALLLLSILSIAPANADPREEKELVEMAQPHLDKIYDPFSSPARKAQALEALKALHARIAELAKADPAFDSRPHTDDFRRLQEDLPEVIAAESKRLGGDDAAAAPADPQPGAYACRGVPLPHYEGQPQRRQIAEKLDQAMAALETHLNNPFEGKLEKIGDWNAKRDALLDAAVLAQIELALADGGNVPVPQWMELLTATDRLLKVTGQKHSAAAEEQELHATYAEYERYFNSMKQDFADGSHTTGFGGSPAGIGAVGWVSEVIVQRIEKLWAVQSDLFADYVFLVKPIETGAGKLVNELIRKGVAQVNHRLRQQGIERRFDLFRPGAAQRRRMIDRDVARLVRERLGIFVRDSARLMDWNEARTFDFEKDGKNCADAPDQSARPEGSKPDDVACEGDGISGNVGCVEKKMGGE